MFYFGTLLSILFLAQAILVKSFTWKPDPQRAIKLQARWENYKDLPYRSQAAVEKVCGGHGLAKCWKPVARPTDEESESCDIYCCQVGHLTGFCQGDVSVDVKGDNHRSPKDEMDYRPAISGFSNCVCTNNTIDAKCGIDGSVLGIRCPFDWSACRRKCCREGRSGGYCGGFLHTKCKCD